MHTIKAKRRAITYKKIQEHKINLKFSIGLFSSILLFVFTYIPFSIILMIDYKDTLPAAYHLYGLVLMRTNSCLNPLLYGLTNTLFNNNKKKKIISIFTYSHLLFQNVKNQKLKHLLLASDILYCNFVYLSLWTE